MNILELRSFFRIVSIFLFFSISSSVFSKNEKIIFRFKIHPNISASECSKIPSVDGLKNDSDFKSDLEFPKVLAKGWVSLEKFSFDEKREFYPCLQYVKVQFPNLKELHKFLLEANACVNDFGADYAFFTSVFEYIARKGDKEAYRIILVKDDRNSASESLSPLYSILRKNPRAFSKVFASLSEEKKRITVQVQYDFNLPFRKQWLKIVGGMSSEEKRSALKFNEMIEECSKKEKEKAKK